MGESPTPPLERLLALVRRELHADDVHVAEPGQSVPDAPNVISAALVDGRHVIASFVAAPPDRVAIERRLGVIVETFHHSLDEAELGAERRPSKPPHVVLSLHDELRAVATRARAIDAVVIDAHSPVVWGSAVDRHPNSDVPSTPELEEALRYLNMSRHDLVQSVTHEVDGAHGAQDVLSLAPLEPLPSVDDERRRELTRTALVRVRQLPGIESLRKGRPLRDLTRTEGLGWLAHSFAAIYLMVLVYEGDFDELRAQRAMTDALPRIERLVLALPPFDPEPEPMADVVSLRARRR